MATCAYCGTTIAFGGKKDGDLRFCNEECRRKGEAVRLAQQIPDDLVHEHIVAVHAGNCPKCNGPGPVDVHTSHRIWSAVLLTHQSSRSTMCCRSCGNKQRIFDGLSCLLLGWWAFPWGLIFTPVQICRNIIGMIRPADPSAPSEELVSAVKADLAEQFIQSKQGEQQPAE